MFDVCVSSVRLLFFLRKLLAARRSKVVNIARSRMICRIKSQDDIACLACFVARGRPEAATTNLWRKISTDYDTDSRSTESGIKLGYVVWFPISLRNIWETIPGRERDFHRLVVIEAWPWPRIEDKAKRLWLLRLDGVVTNVYITIIWLS